MIVNWEGLVDTIQAGKTALEYTGVGTPIDTSTVGWYDHAMGDFGQAADNDFAQNPDVFIMGFHKWGSLTETVAE